jgi:hypothetical protein
MTGLNTDAIDRELASRTKEVTAMSATLIELDNHPGLAHVRRYPPTGVTAQRWPVIEKSLAQLWEDLGRMTSILDTARAVRERGWRLDDDDRAEMTRLLRERPLEVARQPIPLAQRPIAGSAEEVEYVGLADTADRMHATYPAVVEFLDAIDEIDSLIAKGLAPLQKRLDEAGVAAPQEMTELLEISATDPLSLTPEQVERRISTIAELAALQANWPDALAATALLLDALRDATQQAAQIRVRAEKLVAAGPLPVHADAEPGLRAALRSITAPDPDALHALRGQIEAALRVVRDDEQLAQGVLDRRSELKGRLTAYQAKAARLGLGEHPDLLAASRIAAGLLSRQPCDLRAVTRAIADYQQMLIDKRGQTK